MTAKEMEISAAPWAQWFGKDSTFYLVHLTDKPVGDVARDAAV